MTTDDKIYRAAVVVALVLGSAFMAEIGVLLPKVVTHAQHIDDSMSKIKQSLARPDDGNF